MSATPTHDSTRDSARSSTTDSPRLYLAFELGWGQWKLGWVASRGGGPSRRATWTPCKRPSRYAGVLYTAGVNWRLRQHAAVHFSHIGNRKQREHAAEMALIARYFDGKTDGFFVEVGANDPVLFSQTHHLEQLGWSGLLIEPIPELCEQLTSQRPRSKVVAAACSSAERVGTATFHVARNTAQSTFAPDTATTGIQYMRTIDVSVRTLDEILDTHGARAIDFVSVDVEGFQLDVLRGLDLQRHQPALLLIEDHLLDLRTHRWVTQRGYQLVKRTGLNNWYIPAGRPFAMADRAERFALWRKMYLRMPMRILRHAIRKRLGK